MATKAVALVITIELTQNIATSTVNSRGESRHPLFRSKIWPLQNPDTHSSHSKIAQNPPTLRINLSPLFRSKPRKIHHHPTPSRSTPRLHGRHGLEHIGRHGLSLSGSYLQGYSTAYNTRSHIKVVCNGYILTHISN